MGIDLIMEMIEKQNEVQAIAELGRCYRDGKGVGKDLVKAAEWMRKAADQDLGWAKNELFDILWRGFGTSSLIFKPESIATATPSVVATVSGSVCPHRDRGPRCNPGTHRPAVGFPRDTLNRSPCRISASA